MKNLAKIDKIIFFAPDILDNPELPPGEALHCKRVLRKKDGDIILITDGKGNFYESQIVSSDSKKCLVSILGITTYAKSWKNIEIAFAPTKNIDRIEWLVEKATEIGIDKFVPLLCKHPERKEIKTQRIQKILVSAMKQSQKAVLPELSEMVKFADFVKKPFDGQKFIAHCEAGEKVLLKNIYKPGSGASILIGPEGDFSSTEIELALANGFHPVSLGDSRLRTETAALVALNTIHIINQ